MNKFIILLALLAFNTLSYSQKAEYEIICSPCEIEYADDYCYSCPDKTGLSVTVRDGISIVNKNTGEEVEFINAPFKPSLRADGEVEFREFPYKNKPVFYR